MLDISAQLKKPVIRYIVVGGSVYVFELIVIILAQKAGLIAELAVALSFTLGLMMSFVLQKLFTFGDKRMHHKIVITQIVAVGLLIVWNLIFTLLVTKLLTPPVPATVARTIALAITVIWNYYLYKTRIFKQHPSVPLDV